MWLCEDKGLSIDGHYGLGNGVRKPSSVRVILTEWLTANIVKNEVT